MIYYLILTNMEFSINKNRFQIKNPCDRNAIIGACLDNCHHRFFKQEISLSDDFSMLLFRANIGG